MENTRIVPKVIRRYDMFRKIFVAYATQLVGYPIDNELMVEPIPSNRFYFAERDSM